MRQLALRLVLGAALGASAVSAMAGVTLAPGALEMETVHDKAALPGDVADVRETDEARKSRKSEFVVAPLPSRSPLLGWQLSLPAMWLYKPGFTQADDQVWISGAAAFYSESDSYGGGVFHSMSLGGDRWRMRGALFGAELKYDYYGIGGSPDTSIPLRQEGSLALAEALRRVAPNLHAGLRGVYARTSAYVEIPGGLLPPGTPAPDIGVDFDLVTLAPRLQYDSRDNQFYPRTGWLVEGQAGISRSWMGSDRDYEDYRFDANLYRGIGGKSVLAARVATRYVAGAAPFFVYPAFGAQSDLRGYQTGSYRDRFLFAAQAEWRYRFLPRFGAVAFAGVGTVAPDFAGWEETLPSVGAGLRWVIAPKNNMSLRLDIARGKDDTQFYLGIGEAF